MNYEESLAYLDELNVFGMNFLKKKRLMRLLVVRYTPINGSDPP